MQILLIEECQSTANLICEGLDESHFVIQATSGAEALEVLDGMEIDVIIANQFIQSSMTGSQLANDLSLRSDIVVPKFILFTSFDPADAIGFSPMGIDKIILRSEVEDYIVPVLKKAIEEVTNG